MLRKIIEYFKELIFILSEENDGTEEWNTDYE